MNTGLFGVTESIHWRAGSGLPAQFSWSQSPPRIHSPGRRSSAKALSRPMNSSGVLELRRSTLASWKPPSTKWRWPSMSPGTTIALPLASTFVFGPTSAATVTAVAHSDDRVTARGDGAGPRLGGVAGPHPAIHHEIGGRRAVSRRSREDRQGERSEPAKEGSAQRHVWAQRSLVRRRTASSFSRALPPEAAGATEKRSRISRRISSINWSRM